MMTTSRSRDSSKANATKVATYMIEGERLSLEMIVAKYGHEVLAVLRRIKNVKGLQHLDFDDLKQEGYIAMMTATPRFDDSRGLKFTTFIRHRIEGRMRDVIRSGRWRSRGITEQYEQIGLVEEQLSIRLKRTPTMEELSKELGLSVARIHHIRARARQGDLLSFDDPSFEASAASKSVGHTETGYEEAIEHISDRAIIESIIDELDDPQERAVVTLLYWEKLSIKDIAHRLRVGESRCSQIKSRAEMRMREKLGAGGKRMHDFSQAFGPHNPCVYCGARYGRIVPDGKDKYCCADEEACESRIRAQRAAGFTPDVQRPVS